MQPHLAISMMQADLVHLPVRYERRQVQMLYFDMSRKTYGGYQNLAFNYGNSEMFTVYGSGGSSRLQLLPDRFRLVEQNSGISLDDFKGRFEVAMASAARVFGVSSFPFQHVKIRSVAQPSLWNNGIEFLAAKICRFDEEDLEAFERAPTAFTMSFTFLATPEEDNTFTLKIEAYDQAQQNVVLDLEGNFSAGFSPEELSLGAENIQKTYDFISERTIAFLNRYDSEPG